MAAEIIGACRCPLCGGKARLSLSRNLLPVLTCNGCQIQLFARSDRSDQLCRALLVKAPAEPAAAPAPTPAPSAAPAPSIPPAPAPVPVRTEKPLRVGFFGS